MRCTVQSACMPEKKIRIKVRLMNKILSMAYQSKALDATSMMVDMAKLPEKNVRVYLPIYLFWCKTCQQRYPPTEYSATAQKESLTHLDNMWSIWFRLSKDESCLLGVKLERKETLWKSNKLGISLTYHLILKICCWGVLTLLSLWPCQQLNLFLLCCKNWNE